MCSHYQAVAMFYVNCAAVSLTSFQTSQQIQIIDSVFDNETQQVSVCFKEGS